MAFGISSLPYSCLFLCLISLGMLGRDAVAETGLRRAVGHSGGVPTMDRHGPSPPAAMKSPHARLGATIPVQRERTSPAVRLQPHHSLQALAGAPQAAHPLPAGHPSRQGARGTELALSWGGMPFGQDVSAGLLTPRPALLPALRPIPPSRPAQQPRFCALLPGSTSRQGCRGRRRQSSAAQHGSPREQPSLGPAAPCGMAMMPVGSRTACSHPIQSSPAAAPAALLAHASETDMSRVRSRGHGDYRRKASTSSQPQHPQRAPTCFNTDIWAPDLASRVFRGAEIVVVVDKAVEG